MSLSAPFPWFGGKRRVAPMVWERFGAVVNYVEPFFGSGAVLLGRPRPFTGSETVNDLDAYVGNFWRAMQAEPDEVMRFAHWPVNEVDILARHEWLMNQSEFRARMRVDPDYFDAQIAGWWLYGICSWIGSGWCVERGHGHPPEQLPHLGDAGMGIHRSKLPHLGDAGRGIHRSKLPHLGDAGRGAALREWANALAERLSRVRVACGDWGRVMGESVTIKHGLTGVFLDPPYDSAEHSVEYGVQASGVSTQVREWAVANGDNPLLRIALCGYEGEHAMPESWATVAWKARGGYGSQGDGRGRDNAERERIWFSPHCLNPAGEFGLFVYCSRHRGIVPTSDATQDIATGMYVCSECAA